MQHRLAWRACAQESTDSDKTVEYTSLDGAVEMQAAQKEVVAMQSEDEDTTQAGDKGEQEEEEEEDDDENDDYDECEDEDEAAPAATTVVLHHSFRSWAKAFFVGLLASIGGAFFLWNSHYEADKRPIEHGVAGAFPQWNPTAPQWKPLLTVMDHADELDDPEIIEILSSDPSSCGTADE